ncbi:MAG: hypothetical protein SOX71_05380, partial [Candidatus Faecousia sp.]|nr:hypothetical protein [Candidatus Faecousia sp.]
DEFHIADHIFPIEAAQRGTELSGLFHHEKILPESTFYRIIAHSLPENNRLFGKEKYFCQAIWFRDDRCFGYRPLRSGLSGQLTGWEPESGSDYSASSS